MPPDSEILVVHVTTVPMSLTFLRGQARFMSERGIRIRAVSSPGKHLDSFAAAEGVAVHAVTMERRIAPIRDIGAVVALVSHLRRVRPDIVHAHTPKGGLLGMIAATIVRTRGRVYHMRGLPFAAASGSRRYLLWLTEWVSCRLAHEVLCVSQSLRHVAISARLAPESKIRVIAGGSGNGVDAEARFNPARLPAGSRETTRERYGIPEDALVIGFIGRLVRDKGIVELSEAWRRVRLTHPTAHLLLVGPVESQDPLPPGLIGELESDERAHLAGEDWDTPKLYAAMDLVVLPTYREGFPNVLLEAAAMQLPVVATNVPGCIDAVEPGVTGVLIPARDHEQLAAAVGRYLDDVHLRRTHGRAARARVLEQFAQPRIWAGLHDRYQSVLGR
jgi:glycosyltransferase involved in cell wall biosynthesis